MRPRLSKKSLWSAILVLCLVAISTFRPTPSIVVVDVVVDHHHHPQSSNETIVQQQQQQQQQQQHPHCANFASPPPELKWDEVYALEWNGTPGILWEEGHGPSSGASGFPNTRFTPHVTSIVELIDMEQMEDYCFWKFTLTVDSPGTRPSNLHCQGKAQQRIVPWWCKVLERLFFPNNDTDNDNHDTNPTSTSGTPQSANLRVRRRSTSGTTTTTTTTSVWWNPTLPGSVSLAVSSDDFYQRPKRKTKGRQQKTSSQNSARSPYTCLANSAPNNGTFAITNFLELQRMADHTTYAILPWEQRCSVPIWRGSAWIVKPNQKNKQPKNFTIWYGDDTVAPFHHDYPILHQALQDCPRCRAVELSSRHPDLLDAKFGDAKNGFFHPNADPQYQEWWKHNSTNGLDRLLPIHHIPAPEYYAQYQVAVVLCGLGAAFRTPIHFSTATAVVLQSCPNQEWYHFLSKQDQFQPWKHYIPLDAELNGLQQILTWIQTHPAQVRHVAMAGRQFYENYLSFQRNYEHFYELIYRLAMKQQQQQHAS